MRFIKIKGCKHVMDDQNNEINLEYMRYTGAIIYD